LADVRRRIVDAGGDPATIRVVAVTKGFAPSAIVAALANGVQDVGENYAQELLVKSSSVGTSAARWHFLGAVQRRKVAQLAEVVDCWESVTREVEGVAIARRRPGAEVLVQVDTTGLAGRRGRPPSEVPELVERLGELPLRVRGLMTVAPPDRDGARRCFDQVGVLAERLALPERSMGMSDDLELAVAAGSTMLRVGRALFGERRTRG
jgi:PLP dependent protein